jgi:hypothetical protein
VGFGRDIIGEAAVAAEKVLAAKKAVTGNFGPLVLDSPPAKVEAVEEPAAPAPAPQTPRVHEAYNFEQAIEVAKKNPYDLPRLLHLELDRADGPRKTVLKAYRELALRGDLGDEIGLTLADTVDAALAEKK